MAYPCRTRENRISATWLVRVRHFAYGGICVLVFLVMQACHKTNPPAPVITLTLIDQGWSSSDYQGRLNEVAGFTRQTGIRVEFLPGPETAAEQLATYRKLLEDGAKVPDVYGIDDSTVRERSAVFDSVPQVAVTVRV
jgi:hypothetical protein